MLMKYTANGDIPLEGVGAVDRDEQPKSPVIQEKPKPSRLEWRDMADVEDLPEVEWILPGVIAKQSVTLLTGGPKSGKSLFVLAFLKAVDKERPFIGSPIKPKNLQVWCLLEASDYALRAQMEFLRWTPPRGRFPVAYKTKQNDHKMTPKAFADTLLEEYEDAEEKPDLIIVDTLGRWMAEFDINDYSQTNSATEPLLKVADELRGDGRGDGCTVLLLHHRRKAGGTGADSSLGSQALPGAVDTIVELTQPNLSEEIRQLKIQSRFGVEKGDHFYIELTEEREYRRVDGSGALQGEILRILKERAPEGMAPEEICKALGITEEKDKQKVSKAINGDGGLKKQGKTRSEGKGRAIRHFYVKND